MNIPAATRLAAAVTCVVVLATTGCVYKKTLAFGTATKFGLDISQRPDQTVDVTLGYDRGEVASIPVPPNRDAKMSEDTYSLLGYFQVRYGNPWANRPLVLRQFFSTGWAARRAAENEDLQAFFADKAVEILKKAEQKEEGTK